VAWLGHWERRRRRRRRRAKDAGRDGDGDGDGELTNESRQASSVSRTRRSRWTSCWASVAGAGGRGDALTAAPHG